MNEQVTPIITGPRNGEQATLFFPGYSSSFAPHTALTSASRSPNLPQLTSIFLTLPDCRY